MILVKFGLFVKVFYVGVHDDKGMHWVFSMHSFVWSWVSVCWCLKQLGTRCCLHILLLVRIQTCICGSQGLFLFSPVCGCEGIQDSSGTVHFVLVMLTSLSKLNAGYSVRPRIFGFLMVGIIAALMVRLNLTLCSCVFGVKSVKVVLEELSMRLLLCVQL